MLRMLRRCARDAWETVRMGQDGKRGNKKQGVTIKEVAALASVSQMTVSRVLNQRALVKPMTKAKVEAAMAELNYRPNLLARGLAGGKSVLIGFLYYNPSYGYLNEFLVGALDECRALGHHLVVENFAPDRYDDSVERVSARLRKIGLDGFIVAPPLSEHRVVIDALREIGSPFVRVSHGDLSCDDLSVVINDTQAASDITEHLIAYGHKQIAFVMGASNQSSTALRLAGFKSAMSRHRLSTGGIYLKKGDFTLQSGFAAGERLFSLASPPTAIFASNDEMAAGVISAAHKYGVKIPADVSIVGFDDTAIAESTWPPLTTVRQPIGDMARKAVIILADSLSSPQLEPMDRLQILDHEIVERGSVAAPRR